VPGAAQAEQLRVAIIEALSGPQASTGVLYKDAVHYVIGKMNASGGYNGGKIVVTEYDSAGTTAGATAQFKKAVADGVHAVVQGGSSAIAGQLSDDIREHNAGHPGREVLYLNVGAEALELTGSKCHFHSFRFTSTAPMRIGALVRVMKEDGSLGRRVYSINQDYSWGKDVEAAIKANAAQGGYEVVASVLHKVNSIQDFAPFVAEIQAAKPDTVMTGNWSNDLLLMMKAAGAAGLKVRFATTFLDQVGNIGNAGQLTVGHYVAHPFNIELTDGKFARDYEKVTGHVPVYVEPGAVNGMSIFTKGLAATDFNGGAIDVNKVVLAMEQVRYDTALGPLSVRKEDHQMITPIVVSRVEPDVQYPVDGTNLGFEPVKAVPAEQVMYPVQDTCKMKRP
jgi:branched-chain amino acid transport system substrate-binding protein